MKSRKGERWETTVLKDNHPTDLHLKWSLPGVKWGKSKKKRTPRESLKKGKSSYKKRGGRELLLPGEEKKVPNEPPKELPGTNLNRW